MTKLPVAAGIALALVAGSALAADLPRYKAPPPPPPPPSFSWTGLYGGINVGYGFGNGDAAVGQQLFRNQTNNLANFQFGGPAWSLNNDLNGVTGGGQIGYNYQFSPWLVIGVEADIQAADIRNRTFASVIPFPAVGGFVSYAGATQTAHFVDWWGTARGRLGITLPSYPNLLFYATGGYAYGAVNTTFNYGALVTAPPAAVAGAAFASAVYDNTRSGWAAGGGFEWTPMALPTWSLKLEYLYTDLGSITQTGLGFGFPAGFATAATQTIPTRWHTVRAGLNWHFNPFYSAPVLAKY